MYEYVLSNHYEAPGTTNMKLLFQIITILLNVPKYNSMKEDTHGDKKKKINI